MKKLYWIAVVFFFMPCSKCNSGILRVKNLSLSFQYTSSYDSNILRYSERDRSRFQDGTEYYASSISTLDDLKMDYRLTGGYRWYLPGKERGDVKLEVQYSQYYKNPLKNSTLFSATLKQNFLNKWQALVNYVCVPSFYLREFTDVHSRERRGCDYALDKMVGKLYFQPVKLLELIGRCEYKKYAYNKYFTEYDGDFSGLGGEAVIRIGDWRLSGSYNFADFENIGFSSIDLLPPGDYGEDSETGEGDYQEDEYALSAQYSFKLFGKRSRVRFSQTLTERFYTTDRPPDIDPIHHGRKDITLGSSLSGSINLTKLIDITMGIDFTDRDSKGSNPIISDIKDYTLWLGWLEFTYDLY